MVVKVRSWFQINNWLLTLGGTLTISLYLNGASLCPVTVTPSSGQYINVDFELTVRPTSLCRCHGIALLSGGSPVINDTSGSWNLTIAQSIGVTMQCSVASPTNQVSSLSASIETHYQG